jgi:hypothetical protein
MTSRFVPIVLLAVVVTVFPHAASAQTVTQNKTSLVFEIKNIENLIPFITLTPDEQKVADENNKQAIDSTNSEILRAYLESKNSPLSQISDHILQQDNWKLVLAISNGESTLCQHQRNYNCWGIGGAWDLKHYDSYVSAFSDVSHIITDKYIANGADTPTKIVNRYVGHPNTSWVLAVNKTLNDLNSLPLQN